MILSEKKTRSSNITIAHIIIIINEHCIVIPRMDKITITIIIIIVIARINKLIISIIARWLLV